MVDFYGKCRQIDHTRKVWVGMPCEFHHQKRDAFVEVCEGLRWDKPKPENVRILVVERNPGRGAASQVIHQ